MIGLEKGKVRVVAYDKEWETMFLLERNEVANLLKSKRINAIIEHVGSTAVPGLASKPIVDIAIGLKKRSDLGNVLRVLKDKGRDYVKAANQPGMLFMAKGSPRIYHYHLVVFGSPAWTKLIIFRDYLRRHKGVAQEYGNLKIILAQKYPDSRLEYMKHKRLLLLAIMNRAYWEAEQRRHTTAIRRKAQIQESY